MKARFLLATLLFGLAAASHAELRPFTAVYEVRHSGARVGEMTVVLEPGQAQGTYRYTARTTPKGLAALIRRNDVVEVSEFSATDDALRPISYRFDEGTKAGKRNSTIDFDWEAGSAVSEYKGRTETLPLESDPLDRMTVQLMLMRDLARDRLASSYAVIDRNAFKEYTIAELGEERVETPAGQFTATKLRRERDGSSRSSLLWLSKDLGFLPIKIVQLKDGDAKAVLDLKSVEGLE